MLIATFCILTQNISVVNFRMSFDGQLGFTDSLGHQIKTVEQWLDEEPLSPQIRDWLRLHTEVRDALKIIFRERFVPVHAISIVNNPDLKGVKQSIGIYSIDTAQGNKIKQDFLMHEINDTFILYTGIPSKFKESKYVRHVKTLESRYGPDGRNFYKDHHQTIDQVSPDIRPYIEQALNNLAQADRL